MKIFFFLLLLLISVNLTLNAQITIRENNVAKPALTSEPFDSLTNLREQKRLIDYKKFIGHKLFLIPQSKNYKPSFGESNKINYLFSSKPTIVTRKANNEGKLIPNPMAYRSKEKYETYIYSPQISEAKENFISTIPDSVEGKYFTILDIKARISFLGSDKFEDKKLEDMEEKSVPHSEFSITLRNESNNDILTWVTNKSTFDNFFLVPFFEKMKSLYLNKNLVLASTNWSGRLNDLVDLNTGAKIEIKPKEVWTCTDISFIEYENWSKMRCFVFLKNGQREIKIPLEKHEYSFQTQNEIEKYFIFETQFKQQELEQQKKEAEIERKEKEAEKQAKLDEQKFKKDCIKKWGLKMGTLIADNKVVIGMNKEMCIAAWGEPRDINKTITRGLTTEQWVYGLSRYLYFSKGILTGIQN